MSTSLEGWTSGPGKKNQSSNLHPIIRQNTRKTGATVINENQEEIKNAQTGKGFLEKRQYLLCLVGQPTTPMLLTYYLHQVLAMQRITKPIKNAVHAD